MKPKIKELKNGVKLITKPLVGLKAVTIEVGVKIGSKYEDIKEYGLSHFLEHMAFKGTSKRPTAAIINKEIDSRGASYNAGTTHESTIYYITTVKENLPWAMEMLSDILTDPLMEAGEARKEREVIAEEIKMYQDNPRMGLADEFYKFVFGTSAIGCWDVAGGVAEVMKYERQDLLNYRQKMLNAREMVVAVAGDVPDIKMVEEMTASSFGGLKTVEHGLPKVEVTLNQEMAKRVKKTTEQAHFCLGVEGIRRDDKRKYALRLLETIVAGNSSSRLFQEIREDRGWAYYVDSIGQSFTEAGLVAFQSGVKKEKLAEAIDLTKKVLIDLHNSVNDEEMVRAKRFLRGRFGLAMDHSEFWTEYLGQKLLLEGEVGDLESQLKSIEAVKLNEVCELAEWLFEEKKFRTITVEG